MSPTAELVKQISATGFTEAIDLMACLTVLREGNSLVVSHALKERRTWEREQEYGGVSG